MRYHAETKREVVHLNYHFSVSLLKGEQLDRPARIEHMLLLQTKLSVPSLPMALVPRPHLLTRLTHGLSGKLTLMCAPAGSGKTTLMRTWIADVQQREQRASVWLTLDTQDNDLIRFFTYLIAALQRVAPELGQTALAGLETQQVPNIPLFLTQLIHEITTVNIPFILVLDDFHVITAPVLHEAVTFLVDYLPPQMHLVLSSRTVPPIPLARLRTQGQATQIRATDLRFTLSEVTTFFTLQRGLHMSSADMEMLEQRTEGWVAGLHLTAQALQGLDATHASDFLATFAGDSHDIADYLLEEVFHRQPKHIQVFLLQTSILDRFCAPLCDALYTGEGEDDPENQTMSSSQAILDFLEQANLFLVALDTKHHWYRYHHLFTDVLRRQRGQDTSELHRRAAIWFEQEEMLDEAVKHLLAAHDIESAARLIELHAERLFWERNDMLLLLHWFEHLPESSICGSPRLCLTHAWVLSEMYTDRSPLIASRLQAAALLLKGEDASPLHYKIDAQQRLLAEYDILTARLLSQQGNMSDALLHCHSALERLSETHLLLRGIAMAMCAFVEHDIVVVSSLLTQSIALCQAVGNKYFSALFTANLIEVLLVQGQLRQAKKAFQRLLHFPDMHDGPEIGMMCVSIAMVYLERNELQMAETYLQEGIERCRPFDAWAGVVFTGFLRLAWIRSLQNDTVGASVFLEEAEQFEERGRTSQLPFPVPRRETAQARLWLVQDNVNAARSWVTEWRRKLSSQEELRCSDEEELLALIHILLAQTRTQEREEAFGEAKQLVSRLLQMVETTGRKRHVLELYLLRALLDQMRGNISHALTSLELALALAEPEGYIRLFVSEGEPMIALLREVPQSSAFSYCSTLLAAFPLETQHQKSGKDTSTFSPLSHLLTDPLTKQELKTLRLLTTTLAIPEIAVELVVEVSTVRTHIKRIYSKLNVHTRLEAVQKAKELGMLGTA